MRSARFGVGRDDVDVVRAAPPARASPRAPASRVALASRSVSRLSCRGSRCWTSTNAMPVSVRQVLEQLRERLEPAGRGADADDRKTAVSGPPVRRAERHFLRGWHRLWIGRRRSRRPAFSWHAADVMTPGISEYTPSGGAGQTGLVWGARRVLSALPAWRPASLCKDYCSMTAAGSPASRRVRASPRAPPSSAGWRSQVNRPRTARPRPSRHRRTWSRPRDGRRDAAPR